MSITELVARANTEVINPIIILLFVVALVVFLWGVFEFVSGRDNEEKVATGKKHMLWGVIGLAIMASAFGIINLVINFLKDIKN